MNYTNLFYIDPGTGAMLFTVILSLITTLSFCLKNLLIKIKYGFWRKDELVKTEKLPCVIFSDDKRYWNVFKPICDELENRKQECFYWTVSEDDCALSEDYQFVHCQFIGSGNRPYPKLNTMNAYVCLSTTPGLEVYQWKKSKNTNYYLHILHEVGGLTMYRMFGLDWYDGVLLTGDFQKEELRQLETMRNIVFKETCTVGSTYMDALEVRREHTKKEENKNDITVLVAPSWGDEAILNKYGKRFLSKLKESGFNIIIRPHPQSVMSEKKMLDELINLFPDTEMWHWNYDVDNFFVLNNCDVMISDFSGVIFDYAFVFDGPVIYMDTNIDLAKYDACWLKQTTWREKILPQIGHKFLAEEIDEINNIILTVCSNYEYREGRAKAKEEAWMYRGEAASRTVDFILEKIETLKQSEVLDA